MDLEEQYDRIYRYLYFRVQDRHTAEDLTQETFLRFLGSRTYQEENRQLQYLYTIARNLCCQFYRDRAEDCCLKEVPDDPLSDDLEQSLVERISLADAMRKLPRDEREMLFLQYVMLTLCVVGMRVLLKKKPKENS